MFKKYFLPPEDIKVPHSTVDLHDAYHQYVADHSLQTDEAQLRVIDHMQALMDSVVWQDKCPETNVFSKWLTASPVSSSRHLYIYGGVGLGKSMLMDLFFCCCPVKKKRRVHFHAFMQEVHHFVHEEESQGHVDVMQAFADKIRKETLLLCFDEFQAVDIAEAKIVERLFRILFDKGVLSIITSNRHPMDLYRGGLLEDQFRPFVEFLDQSSTVVQLTGKVDYRTIKGQSDASLYKVEADREASKAFVQASYLEHSGAESIQAGYIEVFGRQVPLTAIHNKTLLTSFSELCEQPLAAADYLTIAQQFDTVILSDIPRLSSSSRNEARRFSTLIDNLYEHRVKFICTAVVDADELYNQGKGVFEFKRTVSRLKEMQSAGY